MNEYIIYHNPRCSKSRQALQLLRDAGIEPTIIEYLKTPLAKEQLKNISQLLGLRPKDFVRKIEKDFKYNDLSKLLENSKSNEIFIVDHVQENSLLGFLLMKFVKVHFWGELFNAATIGFVSVKKDRQKRGLGTSLLAASESFAATRSCYILYLQGIKNYYSRFGFIPQFGKSKMTFQTEYEFSDDNRYYEAGQKEFLDIWKTIEEMKEFGENEFDLAIEMFKLHKPVVETPNETRITN